MSDLDFPLIHRLNSILGWLELGSSGDARKELNELPAELHGTPMVLEIRWLVEAADQNWEEALLSARALVQAAPEMPEGWLHQAYALRRVPKGGLTAAWNALASAESTFPEEPIFPYNLACYACQLGKMDQARDLLQRALAIGNSKTIREMALNDSDLEPLWKEIRALK